MLRLSARDVRDARALLDSSRQTIFLSSLDFPNNSHQIFQIDEIESLDKRVSIAVPSVQISS